MKKIISGAFLVSVLAMATPLFALAASGQAAAEQFSPIYWEISRAAAITAYILMFLLIVMGEGLTVGYTYKLFAPSRAWLIHKYLGIALGLAVLTHVFSLLLDKVIGFGLLDLFLPFHSSFQPVFLSAGIFAFYILLAIVLSSLLIRTKSPHLWRNIHFFTYPFFLFAMFHGLMIGTDSHTTPMIALYGLTGVIFWSLLFYRLVPYRLRMK